MNGAEKALEYKKVPSTKNIQWVVYFDGSLIYGYNGKLIWSSYKRAYNAVINMLCQRQFINDGMSDCFIGFDSKSKAKEYVDNLISSGRMEIKKVIL